MELAEAILFVRRWAGYLGAVALVGLAAVAALLLAVRDIFRLRRRVRDQGGQPDEGPLDFNG